ncbi:MAG: hypothetical protein ACRDP1_06315 [Nocardioidaceae bacterium]
MTPGPIVVLILSHRDPPQLQRLVGRVLEGERTIALVHHDPSGAPHGLVESDRVRLVPDPLRGAWGRPSFARTMVESVLFAGREVPDLSWLLMISGQDYPARHLRSIERDLAATDADALLRHFRIDPSPAPDEHPWVAVCRRRYFHRLRVPGSHRSMPMRRPSPFRAGTHLFVGDVWSNLGAGAVRHLAVQAGRRTDISSYLARSPLPDEALLTSLLLNDADALAIRNERHRCIVWTQGEAHPKTLDAADMKVIAPSDFFVRKVEPGRSRQLLALLDERAAAWATL